MPITVECAQCNKKYRVPDATAGKKVKCKACGNLFLVPAAPAGETALDGISDFETSDTGAPAAAPTSPPPAFNPAVFAAPPSPPPAPGRSMPATGSAPRRAPVAEQVETYSNRYDPRRFNRRGNYNYNEFRDMWLPRALFVLGFVVPLIYYMIGVFKTPHPSVLLLVSIIGLMLLAVIAIPTMRYGLTLAGRLLNFEPIEGAAFKQVAAFCTPVALAVALGNATYRALKATGTDTDAAHAAAVGPALLGFFIGLILTFFVLWFFLRVRFVQALVSWVFSGIFFIIGNVITLIALQYVASSMKSVQDAISGKEDKPETARVQVDTTPALPTPPDTTLSAQEQIAQSRQRALQAARDTSANNLRQIVAALRAYARARNGNYPPTLDALAKETPEVAAYLQSPVDPLSTTGYTYLYLLKMTLQNTPDDIALVYDQADLDKSNETNVAFANGSVRRMGQTELSAFKERSLDIRRVEPAVATGDATPSSGTTPMPSPAVVDNTPRDATATTPAGPRPYCNVKPDAADEKKKLLPTLSVNIPVPAGSNVNLFYSTPPSTCVMVSTDNFVSSWDLAFGGKRIGILKDRLPSDAVAFSPDGAYMALLIPTAPNGGEVGVFTFANGAKLRGIQPETGLGDLRLVGFVGSTQLITSTSNPRPMLQMWDLKTGVRTHEVEIPATDTPDTLRALSATGRYYAFPNETSVKLFNLETAAQDANLELPSTSAAVRGLCFSNDGKELTVLASGKLGGTDILLYDLTASTGQPAASIPMLGSTATGRTTLQYLPDKTGWLMDDAKLVDRLSGRTFYVLPPLKAGLLDGRPLRMLDLYTVLLECKPQGTVPAVVYRGVKLPKPDIDAALKAARGG